MGVFYSVILSQNVGNKIKRRIEDMFCKKGTADKRQLVEGVHLSTLVHGEKTLMGQFYFSVSSVPRAKRVVKKPALASKFSVSEYL